MKDRTADAAREDKAREDAVPEKLTLARVLHRVSCRDVCDLVRHHSGKLGLIVGRDYQALIDIEEASGECKGVYLVAVNDLDGERDLGVGMKNYVLADAVHVLGDHRVFHQLCLLFDLRCKLAAQLDLLFPGTTEPSDELVESSVDVPLPDHRGIFVLVEFLVPLRILVGLGGNADGHYRDRAYPNGQKKEKREDPPG